MKYSLNDIIHIKNSCEDNIISELIDEDIKRYLFIVEYKFKDKKGHRSKYNNPKPISFNDIRISLNKLSIKHFNVQFKYIISTIHLLPSDDMVNTFENIFIHLSQNSFMLEPYSKLAVILIDIFDDFKTLFYNKFETFLNDFNTINFPNVESYEEICIQNKIKDQIKSQSTFLVTTLISLNEFEYIKKYIVTLQTYIKENFLIKEQTNNIEFISNMYKVLAIKCIKDFTNTKDIISTHVDYILQNKNNKNINRKIIFHHMDIIDCLKISP